MAIMTKEDLSLKAFHRPCGAVSMQERIFEFRKEFDKQWAEAIEERAAQLAKGMLNGPRTHKYRGVAVTEEQFWQFMATEGFHKPEADPIG